MPPLCSTVPYHHFYIITFKDRDVLLPYPKKTTWPKKVCPQILNSWNISYWHPKRLTMHRFRSWRINTKLQKEKEDRATKRAETVKQKLKEKEQLRLKQSMKRTVMFLLWKVQRELGLHCKSKGKKNSSMKSTTERILDHSSNLWHQCGKIYGSLDGPKRNEEWCVCDECHVWYHESWAKTNGIVGDGEFLCYKCVDWNWCFSLGYFC